MGAYGLRRWNRARLLATLSAPLMVTTKRYDYIPIEQVQVHPLIQNHRELSESKVAHYQDDILKNGLLEPLVVWERNRQEYFLIGGFHRLHAIQRIRRQHPDYYDRIDVRVIAGELSEVRALNLKLNADRLDAKIHDYFDTILYLNNAAWTTERIGSFLDKSTSWVEDILRYVPGMDPRVRQLLQEGKLSWSKAKQICRRVLQAEPGLEKETADVALAELSGDKKAAPRAVLTPKAAHRRLEKHLQKAPEATYRVTGKDLFALLSLLAGKGEDEREENLERVREIFPGLVD